MSVNYAVLGAAFVVAGPGRRTQIGARWTLRDRGRRDRVAARASAGCCCAARRASRPYARDRHDAARVDGGALVEGIRAGDTGALARAISLVEDRDPAAYELVRELYPLTGHAHAVGLTGAPGVGKSSLSRRSSGTCAPLGKTVGVVSVDPSSPFTQGALLGDRIRLTDHFLDPGVFIRSMGTRGHAGGLAESTLQALLLLDASGKDVVFLETVGTGQSDVGVLSIADTVVLALMPGSGDSVQALKAGIMEIPDVIAINKADHPQARQTANDVRQVLALAPSAPQPPIVLTEALRGEGVDELWAAIDGAPRRARGRRHARGAPPPQPRGRGVRGRVGARAPPSRACGRRRPRAAAAARRGRAAASSIRSPPCIPSSRPCSTSPTIPEPMATKTGPTLADIEAARERIGDRARDDAGLRLRGAHVPHRAARSCSRPRTCSAPARSRSAAPSTSSRRSRAAEREAGVIAASAGNHGQAVAYAARELGVRATIVMPQDAPMSKVDPTLRYGAEAVLHGATFDDALAEARRRVEETGATLIHAFEDERVIAGQGTIGLELAEQLPTTSRRC